MASQQIRTPQDIKQLGTIVGVWAHPDDESFSCGGLIATATRHGQPVACITATRGEAGVQDENRWPASQLASIRTAEMEQALQVLGVKRHHWLDYADGSCADIDLAEVMPRLTELLALYQPDTILTFGPEGMTGHLDHQTVSKWVDMALPELNKKPRVYHAVHLKDTYDKHLKSADEQFDIFFNIDEPPLRDEPDCDICYQLPPDIVALKCRALQAMPSQTEAMFKSLPETTMQAMLGIETFVLK